MLVHLFSVIICDQERDIVTLFNTCYLFVILSRFMYLIITSIGFLRKITKFSALNIKKRENLWHNIRSRSSACLILMLTRTEFTEGSIRTFSFSLRLITKGFINTSFDFLYKTNSESIKSWHFTSLPNMNHTLIQLQVYYVFQQLEKRSFLSKEQQLMLSAQLSSRDEVYWTIQDECY